MTKWQTRALARVDSQWRSAVQLKTSYQVLSSLHRMRLVERRARPVQFANPVNEWRKI